MKSLEEFFIDYYDTKYLIDAVLGVLNDIGNPEVKVTKSQIAFF